MPQVHKVLGQVIPSAATLTNLYTVPAATSTIVSTLAICNQTASARTFRIAVKKLGVSISDEMYIAYDAPIAASDSIFLTIGITLSATDVIAVQSTAGSVGFSLFGAEIS
jgi:hypothetical protein